MGGIETGLIFALRQARQRRLSWPFTFMAILAAAFLAAGVLRHYWDIYTHRTVRGISFIFVGIDAAGDLFSLISVFFQAQLDVLGMVIYGTELILWLGVFACGGWFNLQPWVKSRLRERKDRNNQSDPMPLQTDSPATGIEGNEMARPPSSTSVFRTASSLLHGRATAASSSSIELG